MDDSRSQNARPLHGTFFGLSSHMSDQSVHTNSMYPRESGPALMQFLSRNDGGNISTSAKLTTETVTTSAYSSSFVAPAGRLGQRAHLVTYKQLRGFIFHLVFIQDPLAQLCPAFYLERLARSPPLLLILLINFCICWVLFLPSFQAFSTCKKGG